MIIDPQDTFQAAIKNTSYTLVYMTDVENTVISPLPEQLRSSTAVNRQYTQTGDEILQEIAQQYRYIFTDLRIHKHKSVQLHFIPTASLRSWKLRDHHTLVEHVNVSFNGEEITLELLDDDEVMAKFIYLDDVRDSEHDLSRHGKNFLRLLGLVSTISFEYHTPSNYVGGDISDYFNTTVLKSASHNSLTSVPLSWTYDFGSQEFVVKIETNTFECAYKATVEKDSILADAFKIIGPDTMSSSMGESILNRVNQLRRAEVLAQVLDAIDYKPYYTIPGFYEPALVELTYGHLIPARVKVACQSLTMLKDGVPCPDTGICGQILEPSGERDPSGSLQISVDGEHTAKAMLPKLQVTRLGPQAQLTAEYIRTLDEITQDLLTELRDPIQDVHARARLIIK